MEQKANVAKGMFRLADVTTLPFGLRSGAIERRLKPNKRRDNRPPA
jgi:hypothetical protein